MVIEIKHYHNEYLEIIKVYIKNVVVILKKYG